MPRCLLLFMGSNLLLLATGQGRHIRGDGRANQRFEGGFIDLFAFVNVANNLPKLAANNRDKATVEEAKAIVAGSIAYYGTYTVDEGTKTIVPKVEGSTFPNMVGTDQSRIVTSITADEMRFTNPKAPAGVLEIVWRRAK